MINRMQCTSTIACHLERARGLEDLKRGIRGRPRNSSPLVSLLNKRIYKFKSRDLKSRNLLFSNFKIPFTRKSWLLQFDFACNLAQILEPKQIRSVSFYFAFYKITKTLAKWKAKMLDDIILAVLVYFATFLFMLFILAFFAFWYISVPLLVIYIVIKFIRHAKECERICGKLE